MHIGEAAAASGLPAKTIPYYEDIDRVRPARCENGYRDFSECDAHDLMFLARVRSLGFSIEDCRTLLSLYKDRDRASADVKRVVTLHLRRIARKIEELRSMQATLETLVARCHGDDRPTCPILDDLARPGRPTA